MRPLNIQRSLFGMEKKTTASRTSEDSDCDAKMQPENQRSIKDTASRKRKCADYEEAPADNKRAAKTDQKPAKPQRHNQSSPQQTAAESCAYDNGNDDDRSDTSDVSTANKKKKPLMAPQFYKLQDIEDKSPLCVIGEAEANMFPKKLRFMNHTIDVMYDSRVHMWLKADDFAKALGYKNYKSTIERFVNPSFVRTFPEVLDMSRTRYGDAFRLYPVNSKALFINEAGVLQLLLRSMITTNDSANKEEGNQRSQNTSARNEEENQQDATATTGRGPKHHPKPKLSADWINYQILPSLIAFSEAAKNGITAQEERRLQSMNYSFTQ